jgi:Tfp pilus assembly protein PilF
MRSTWGTRWSTTWGTTWSTTGAIALVVVCLAGVDQFLARVESAETINSAQRSYQAGSRLLEAGKAGEAIDFLRDAHALERQNPEYELELIDALASTGKTTAAEPLLTEILQREPNDGRANLTAARLAIRGGNTAEGEAYYHRAIFGEWSGGAVAHRVAARLELIDLLAGKNRKQELLAELISLEAESPLSAEIRKRLGELFLLAGSPARAANVYQALVERDPKDIGAYEGLGEAELEEGQYRPAREAFLRAFNREPNNASVRAHLQTLNTVAELDPTLRQLTSAEKYSRSMSILNMTRAALDECLAKTPAANSDDNRQLLKTADAANAAKAPAHVANEAAEGVLALAEKLWKAHTAACGDRPSDRNALNLIMNKLAS